MQQLYRVALTHILAHSLKVSLIQLVYIKLNHEIFNLYL